MPDTILPELRLSRAELTLAPPAAPLPELPATPLRVGGEVMAPVKLHAPPPVYTEPARRARIQGTVIVEAMIDDAGKVQLLRLIKGLPLGLDRQALEAVGRWRFEPATLRGRPVQVLYNLQIHFRLE